MPINTTPTTITLGGSSHPISPEQEKAVRAILGVVNVRPRPTLRAKGFHVTSNGLIANRPYTNGKHDNLRFDMGNLFVSKDAARSARDKTKLTTLLADRCAALGGRPSAGQSDLYAPYYDGEDWVPAPCEHATQWAFGSEAACSSFIASIEAKLDAYYGL